MKYWLYRDKRIIGPYEMEELAGFPDFDEDSLICPEDLHGKQSKDWQKAGKIREIVDAILERSKVRAALSGVHKQVDSLEKARARVEKELKDRTEETRTLADSLSQVDARTVELRGKLAALEKHLNDEKLRRDYSRIQYAQGLEALQRNMGGVITTLREKIDALESRLKDDRIRRDKALELRNAEQTDDLRIRIDSRIGGLRDKIDALQKQVHSLSGSLQNKEALEREKRARLRNAWKLGSLQKQVRSLISGLRNKVEELRKRRESEAVEPDRRPLRLPRPWVLAAMGAAAALAFWFWPDPGRVRTFEIPHANPTAVVWRGNRLWTADWKTGKIYEFELRDGTLTTLRDIALTSERVTGLALSENHLFLCNATAKRIERRLLDDKLTLVDSLPSPGPSPSALFWDGRYLWSADRSTRMIYQHAPDKDLSVVASYLAPAHFPSALYKDDDYLWSADAETRLLYRHQLNDTLGVFDAYGHPQIDRGGESLSGFTWRKDEVWLARDGEPRLHVIDRKSLVPRL